MAAVNAAAEPILCALAMEELNRELSVTWLHHA